MHLISRFCCRFFRLSTTFWNGNGLDVEFQKIPKKQLDIILWQLEFLLVDHFYIASAINQLTPSKLSKLNQWKCLQSSVRTSSKWENSNAHFMRLQTWNSFWKWSFAYLLKQIQTKTQPLIYSILSS